jgi:hypothetical protein
MDIVELIESRWKPFAGRKEFEPLKQAVDHALTAHRSTRDRRAEISRDPDLSSEGRTKAMRKHVADLAPQLRHAKASIDAARQHLASRRAKMLPPAPDKSDVAGATLRSEFRAMLRPLPLAKKIDMLLNSDVDLMIVQAVLESPMLAGIDGKMMQRKGVDVPLRDLVADRYAEKAYPGELAAIAEAEEAITVLGAATTTAIGTITAASGFRTSIEADEFIAGTIDAGKAAIIDREAARWLEPLSELSGRSAP